MPTNQRAGKHGREGELNHHDAIEGRCGQNDNGAEGGLNQTKPEDAKPAYVRGA